MMTRFFKLGHYCVDVVTLEFFRPFSRQRLQDNFQDLQKNQVRIPTVKLKIPGKRFFKVESRTSVTFKLQFLTLDIYQWRRLGLSKSATMKKNVKNVFLTEILDSTLKKRFPGIFNFTVGILFRIRARNKSIFWLGPSTNQCQAHF